MGICSRTQTWCRAANKRKMIQPCKLMLRFKCLITAQTNKITTGDFIYSSMSRQSVCGLSYEATSNCRALGDKMNSEWHAGKGLEGSCPGLIEVLPRGTEENHENNDRVPVGFRTRHLWERTSTVNGQDRMKQPYIIYKIQRRLRQQFVILKH